MNIHTFCHRNIVFDYRMLSQALLSVSHDIYTALQKKKKKILEILNSKNTSGPKVPPKFIEI